MDIALKYNHDGTRWRQSVTLSNASLEDIKAEMNSNFLSLNSNKTKVVVFKPKCFRNRLCDVCLSLATGMTVRDSEVIFNQDLSFCLHIK